MASAALCRVTFHRMPIPLLHVWAEARLQRCLWGFASRVHGVRDDAFRFRVVRQAAKGALLALVTIVIAIPGAKVGQRIQSALQLGLVAAGTTKCRRSVGLPTGHTRGSCEAERSRAAKRNGEKGRQACRHDARRHFNGCPPHRGGECVCRVLGRVREEDACAVGRRKYDTAK